MFYYIAKITIYSAPLVLVILDSEFDVIFKWIYVYMETVVWLIVVKSLESLSYRREFMPWKKIYSSADKVSNVILLSMLFYHQSFSSNCTDWLEARP